MPEHRRLKGPVSNWHFHAGSTVTCDKKHPPKQEFFQIKQGGYKLHLTLEGSKLSVGVSNPSIEPSFYCAHFNEKNAWKLVEWLNRVMA